MVHVCLLRWILGVVAAACLHLRLCPISDASPLQPHPFVRVVIDYMDNAGGTNKSQFVFGGFGLRVAAGDYDAVLPTFMVPGHTKFDSDVVCQKLGTAYNRSDVFNHGMLNSVFSPYARVHAYDGRLLRSFKEASSSMFSPITHITQYRSFAIVADDGLLRRDLKVATDVDITIPDDGSKITDESLRQAMANLTMRSLKVIIPVALRGKKYSGVGQGTGLYGPPSKGEFLSPRTVLLFKRMTETSEVWVEQRNWHKISMVKAADINMALDMPYPIHDHWEVTFEGSSYFSGPLHGKTAYYGKKLEQIALQYKNWVPAERTPDTYELSSSGATRELSSLVRELIVSCRDEAAFRLAEDQNCMGLEDKRSAEVGALYKLELEKKLEHERETQALVTASGALSPCRFVPSRPPLVPPSTSNTEKHNRYSFKEHDSVLIGKYGEKEILDAAPSTDREKTKKIALEMNFTTRQIRTALERIRHKRRKLAVSDENK